MNIGSDEQSCVFTIKLWDSQLVTDGPPCDILLQLKEEKENTIRIIMFIADDLQKRLNFIEETYQYNDFKPFFTDMWDAIILAGKHALLPFELLQSLQR